MWRYRIVFFTSEQPRGTKCRHSLERVLFLACNSDLYYFLHHYHRKSQPGTREGPAVYFTKPWIYYVPLSGRYTMWHVPAQPIVIDTEFSELTENLLRCQTALSLLWKENVRIIKLYDTEGTQTLDPFTKSLRPVPSLVNIYNC